MSLPDLLVLSNLGHIFKLSNFEYVSHGAGMQKGAEAPLIFWRFKGIPD